MKKGTIAAIKEVQFLKALKLCFPQVELPFRIPGHICCPFPSHIDNTPSCYICDDHFYCFGCHAHGDILDFAQKYRMLGLKQASSVIVKRLGIKIKSEEPSDQDSLQDLISRARENPREPGPSKREWENLLNSLQMMVSDRARPYMMSKDWLARDIFSGPLGEVEDFLSSLYTSVPSSWTRARKVSSRSTRAIIQTLGWAEREVERATGRDRIDMMLISGIAVPQ